MRQMMRKIRDAIPASLRAMPAGRFLSMCYGHCINAVEDVALHWSLPAQTARVRLQAAGFPLKRQFLVLRCMEGEEASGLFSEFEAVLGALGHFEKWSDHYAGIRIDFGNHGLYFDAAFGANWWQYYFEPINIGCTQGAVPMTVTRWQHDAFVANVEHEMSRNAAAEILDRHIRIKSHLRERVDSYVREHFEGAFIVGIHYRGTDKQEEVRRIPYEVVAAEVRGAADSAHNVRYKLFVATDEQQFLNYVLRQFPGKVVYRELPRSIDGRPTHKTGRGGFQKGEDAVVDCLLLSRCNFLLRTTSHLSLCATFFNPNLPEKLIEPATEAIPLSGACHISNRHLP